MKKFLLCLLILSVLLFVLVACDSSPSVQEAMNNQEQFITFTDALGDNWVGFFYSQDLFPVSSITFVFSQNEHERTCTIYDYHGIKYEELAGEGAGYIAPNSYMYVRFPQSKVIYEDAYFEDGNMTLTVRKSLQGEVIATYEFYYIAP